MRNTFLFSAVALCIAGCNTSKIIFRERNSKSDYLEIRKVNYSHCGCAHVYAEKFMGDRKVFFIAYTNNGITKSIFRYNVTGMISDTVLLQGVNTNEFTIPLDTIDMIIFNKIDSFAQKSPAAPVYKLQRPAIKGYVRKEV
jgi:hypothetical protein